ncbi:uncharacterized protein LOC123322559 [Coccinella septempunctata]|uniref:uncharacterized protein LOC123322559 n=1 Tax=Coccinella septempunctata TaxID=41139 RepID=UPI001D071917|nr:uncharacterized protein LOC123322559 [Coccinella septempunctata]
MLLNHVSAFFWSSGETTHNPYYIYQRRMPPSYNIPYSEPSLPAVPVQVPLQAQLSPHPSVQNVQLVPCLCPISTDYEQVKPENYYLTPPAQHAPPPNNQNQVKNGQN